MAVRVALVRYLNLSGARCSRSKMLIFPIGSSREAYTRICTEGHRDETSYGHADRVYVSAMLR